MTGRLITALVLSNASADEIKDFLMNRQDASLSDNVVENLLKLFMMSRYQMGTAKREGVGSAIADSIFALPVKSLLDAPSKDFMSWMDKDKENTYKTMKFIPIVGKVGYEYTKAGRKDKLKRIQEKIKEYKDNGRRVPTALKVRLRQLKRSTK
jgi:hypothetical protein